MGCFHGMCQITRRTIHAGDPCVLVIAQRETPHGWVPASPPLRGVYNDYGSIEDTPEFDAWRALNPEYERPEFYSAREGTFTHIMFHAGVWEVFLSRRDPKKDRFKDKLFENWGVEDGLTELTTLLYALKGRYLRGMLEDLLGESTTHVPSAHPLNLNYDLQMFLEHMVGVEAFAPPHGIGGQESNQEVLAAMVATIPIREDV